MLRRRLCLLAAAAAGCGASPARPPAADSPTITISVVGTNDVHGHIGPEAGGRGGVALLGGYLANLRAARAADGGGVLLVDAGDMFQGTLESNAKEGEAVVAAYNALGYAATTLGNHEFDFGPAGELVVPRGPEDDPRGALRARAAEASFPFLDANVIDVKTGAPMAGKGFSPTTIREVAGVKIGIIGLSTADTPTTTQAANFRGLAIRPLAETIDDLAPKLRAEGAEVIVVIAHSGMCQRVSDEEILQECDFGEILDAVRALEQPIDVVIAGHTHAGVIRREGNVALSEAWKFGRGFGRVDITFDRKTRKVLKTDIQPPRLMVQGDRYEGRPVVPDPKVAAVVAPYIAAAESRRNEELGVTVETQFPFAYDQEAPLGNLVADYMLDSRPKADAAITNGGSLRRGFDAGKLTYGVVFEAYPFDNRYGFVKMTGADLRKLFSNNLRSAKGILNVSGLHVAATCKAGELDVRVSRADGREIGDAETLNIVTSDFLVNGGMEGAMETVPAPGSTVEASGSIREEVIDMLRKRKGVLRGDDKKIYDPDHLRITYPGKRPVICPPTGPR